MDRVSARRRFEVAISREVRVQTELFQELHAILGDEAMFVLLSTYGGTRIHVPARVKPTVVLAKLLGIEALTSLVEAFAGDRLHVPLANVFCILVLRSRGHSHSQIARQLNRGEATVRKALSNARLTGVQPPRPILKDGLLDVAKLLP